MAAEFEEDYDDQQQQAVFDFFEETIFEIKENFVKNIFDSYLHVLSNYTNKLSYKLDCLNEKGQVMTSRLSFEEQESLLGQAKLIRSILKKTFSQGVSPAMKVRLEYFIGFVDDCDPFGADVIRGAFNEGDLYQN